MLEPVLACVFGLRHEMGKIILNCTVAAVAGAVTDENLREGRGPVPASAGFSPFVALMARNVVVKNLRGCYEHAFGRSAFPAQGPAQDFQYD
jgi:hypothetical protein